VSELWAVSAYFNTAGAASRLRNHRCMRGHLPVPLLTVEWSPTGDFELEAGRDADVLVQLSGGDVLWQKERLLNVGFAALPPEVEAVAWVDASVVLVHDDWPAAARAALDRHAVAQGFARLHYLDAEATAALAGGRSAPAALLARAAPERVTPASARLAAERGVEALVAADVEGHATMDIPVGATRLPRNPGVAWLARREVLDRLGGLYDRAVVGSGDWLLLLAVLGAARPWLDAVGPLGYGYLARSSYPTWADHAAATVGGDVGWVEADALHLYHGRLADRRYKVRHPDFDALGVDLDADLQLTAAGVWELTPPRPDVVAHVTRYLAGRDEDQGLVHR
jgi:hypothetical protein